MQQKTFGELLKDSWELYTTQFKYILLLVVFFYFPFQLITTFTLPEETLIPTSFEAFIAPPPDTPDTIWTLVGNISWVVGSVFTIIISISIILIVAKTLRKEQFLFSNLVKEAFQYFIPALLTTILLSLWLVLLFFLLIIPGIIFLVYWAFVMPTIVMGGKKYIKALQYSKSLVKGRWWQVCGRYIGLGLILGSILITIGLTTSPVMVAIPWLQAVLYAIFEIIAAFAGVFTALYFLDLQRTAPRPL
ncbi:MAG TPA: hypothetical protein VJB65_01480 [Patescibacteria group bacterium]|nr:hypothetical protein [Patescibacteria group bacterium]